MDESQIEEHDGFVYLMVNDSHHDLVKIGKSKDPGSRARDGNTWAPTPFIIHQIWITSNRLAAEKCCHQLLAKYRVKSGREFFFVPTGVRIDKYECEISGEEYEVPSWPLDDLVDWLTVEVQRQVELFYPVRYST